MSHTAFEDEGRRLHFEEWDRVLDDHLDTVHALEAGVDPGMDVVWDDAEFSPLQQWWDSIRTAFRVFFEEAAEGLRKVVPQIREAWEKVAAAARGAIGFMSDLVDWQEELETSGPPPKPVWVDRSRVSWTSTRPVRTGRPVYRRRTP